MRILMPIDRTHGGAFNTSFTLAKQLKKKGHTVTFLAPEYNGSTTKEDIEIIGLDLKKTRYPVYRRRLLALSKRLDKLSREYDLIHTQGYFTTLPFLKQSSKPIVSTIRDYWPISYRRNLLDQNLDIRLRHPPRVVLKTAIRDYGLLGLALAPYLLKIQKENRKLLSRSKKLICMSNYVEKVMKINNFKNTITIKNAVDFSKFTAEEKETEFRVLYLGGDQVAKGGKYLIKAAKKGGFCTIIVGMSKGKKTERNITFLPYVSHDKIPSLISTSSVVVVPSIWPEPLSRVILETFALKKPVIATDTGGSPEIVEDGINGFLIKPKSASAIQKAVKKMQKIGKAERDQMGLNGFQKVKKEHNPKRIAEQHLKVYKEVLT